MNEQDFGIKRVSVNSSGSEANGDSRNAAISGNGRFVAFESGADNLVSGDTNEAVDVFVHNLETGTTTRVSVGSGGTQGNDVSRSASISADGRFVVFSSEADNLVEGDANETGDIFIHEIETGVTGLVSVGLAGEAGNGISRNPTISADGRFVAFSSEADNLVEGDTNEVGDIFIHEIETGITSRVSVGSSGNQANGNSINYSMSANGRFVIFESDADNLVPGEEDCAIYVRDRLSDATTCITAEANPGDDIGDLSISNDGRFIAFESVKRGVTMINGVPTPGPDDRPRVKMVLHDRQTGENKEIPSLSATSGSTHSISADGRFIAFTQGTPKGPEGAFIYDVRSEIAITTVIFKESENERTQSLSVPPTPTSWITQFPTFSADGSVIAFNSFDNLVLEDTNNLSDIFVLDNVLAANRAEVPPSEGLIGTADSDRLLDLDNQNSILGLEGNDTIDGGNGADEIFGNQGDDTIDGGSGADEIFGNQGNDRIEGNNDSDTIYGGKDSDTLNGEDGEDWLRGDRGEDWLRGLDGNDILFGGKGNDTLWAGRGDDRLSGDLGDDLLSGGAGQDTFVLAVGGGNDTISSFEDGIDRLELAGGLTFSQLAILPGEEGTISIVLAGTDEVIGTIARATEIAIAADDFIFG